MSHAYSSSYNGVVARVMHIASGNQNEPLNETLKNHQQKSVLIQKS